MTRLLEPASEWRSEFLSMAQEWHDVGVDRYADALHDFAGYLQALARMCDPELVEPPLVPQASFWLEHDGQIVACVRLRLWLTPSLAIEGGHVGYDVRPSARRRGFGTAALGLVLPEAQRRGIDRVLVTTDDDNIASIRIIEKNGGVLSGTAVSPESGKLVRQYWLTPRGG